jgi:hypothetical protein
VNFHEVDWRFSSTKCVFQALSDGLKSVRCEFNKVKEDFETDDILEFTESLLGIAFVTAQTYIAGTISDAYKLMGSNSKLTKKHLLKKYSDDLTGASVTKVELCDAVANYFKHHDEWNGCHKDTVSILFAVGIKENDNFPCRKAADILWSNNDDSNLEPLLSLISNWRRAVIADVRRG